jgi:pantoate--beta-alanine ligase
MSLQLVQQVGRIREAVAGARRSGASVGLVPTMGALHAGHGSLIDRARAECAYVVVSIFVNPLQFDRPDDYERYARTLAVDLDFCRERGADLVFAPAPEEIYPGRQRVYVDAPELSEYLCGMYRPGHFRGVATVVAKLFNIVQPDRAYFGEKDAQQLAIIEALVKDLNLPVDIVPAPTVRESDGLALSSRNTRLSPEERRSAASIYRALSAAASRIAAGAEPGEARQAAMDILRGEPLLRVEYLEVVDAASMRPVDEFRGPVRIAAAVWAGETRLIDNVRCPGPADPLRT